MSGEKWLNELDPGLVVYADNLKQLGFCSVKMIKFLKLKDLQKMQCTIPAPHRRMILNAFSKLQTPESKNKGDIETADSEDDGVKRRRKENVSSDDLMSNKSVCTGVHSACRREENGLNLDICVLRRLRLRQRQVQGFLGLKVGGGS